jgi:hypothetical protein
VEGQGLTRPCDFMFQPFVETGCDDLAAHVV